MKKIDRYFRTSSFPIAAFLFAKDLQIAGVNPTGNSGQMEFAFIDSPHLEELVDLYRFGPKDDDRLLINVHKYEQARKELLALLKG